MLIQQYISEFNKQASNNKLLSYTDEIALVNKLKLIQGQDVLHVCSSDVQDFFSNIYHLLCQSGYMKSELLGICLEILLTCINSRNTRLRVVVLSDFRFLSALIANVMEHGNDESKLIKILTLIRELLAFSSELDEHNLKLIVEALRDYTVNHQNKEISTLCLQVLANLCLQNNAARHLITRTIKTTELQDKIKTLSDGLVAFKFFLLMEDEVYQSSDIKYFFILSLQELRDSVHNFSLNSIRHSLDILRHFAKLDLEINMKLTDDETFMKRLEELNLDLITSFLDNSDSEAKWSFFDGVFNFYDKLLIIDSELVETLQKFAETVFISGVISKSTSALKFLSSFIACNGTLGTLGIVIESLLDVFITDSKETITYEQKYAFLSLLDPLQSKEKLSDDQLHLISEHFDDLIGQFKKTDVARIDEEEMFLFVYFLKALSSIAKTRMLFYGKLNTVLELDFLAILVAKAHLSKNEDILMILFELSRVDNFPNKKIVSLLAKSGTRSETVASQSLYQSLQRRDIQTKNAKFISLKMADELFETIQRVNTRLDNNEDAKDSDIAHLNRMKISYLNDHLTSITSSLDRSTTEINELNQKIASFRTVSEKQEFNNWCLQLDKERMVSETQSLISTNKMLQDSLSSFKSRIDKEETRRHKSEEALKSKIVEIEHLTGGQAKLEEKLAETKERLRLAKDENESRINELKQSLENEKKLKAKDLADALSEQKRLTQKLVGAEKENQKLQEIIKHNEKELVSKQEKIQNYEVELKESEQMKSTILNLMQTKSFRK